MQEHERWLKIAGEDLRSAKILFENDAFDNSAYSTQQSAEKSLKAYLVSQKHKIEKTHDLIYLLKICFKYDSDIWNLFSAVKELNPFSTRSRYPDDFEALDKVDAYALIQRAEEVLNFVKSKLCVIKN